MHKLHLLISTLLLLICEDSALLCNMCQSEESWSHCAENRTIVDCSSADPDFGLCFKAHIVTKTKDSEKHIYKKGCGNQEICSGEQCTNKGDWCLVNCCNTDNCNDSLAVKASTYLTYSLVGISLALHLR